MPRPTTSRARMRCAKECARSPEEFKKAGEIYVKN